MKKILTALTAASTLAFLTNAYSQAQGEFEISKISAEYIKTPDFTVSGAPNKRAKAQEWLEVEVEFAWTPNTSNLPQTPYLDDLTLNYYVLLNNAKLDPQHPRGMLLTGQVNHVSVAPGKGLRSVIYVSPRTLQRLFAGKVPPTAKSAVQEVGVTIARQGQLVAGKNINYKGNDAWWTTFQQMNGYLLNKNDTPFAPLYWDYYEPIKPKS